MPIYKTNRLLFLLLNLILFTSIYLQFIQIKIILNRFQTNKIGQTQFFNYFN
jgi:hypothetical protein